MKKKIVIGVIAVVVIALIFGCGQLMGVFPWQYLSEDKVASFLEDSQYAFVYELPDSNAKDEYDSVLNNELETEMAAVTYAARNDFKLDEEEGAYVIPEDKLNEEKTALFLNPETGDVIDSTLLTASQNGYLLHLDDASDLSYEITDSFYGLIGSESTRITVLYKLNGKECSVTYSLASDKDSPYSFKVVDITVVE